MEGWQTLTLPGRLPGMNDIIEARRITKGKWNKYTEMKARWGSLVGLLAKTQGFRPIISGHFHYRFREKDKRRDPSNILGGAMKLIEDGLVDAGLLANDGWGNVLSISSDLEVHAEPSVIVTIEVQEWAK